jgi:NAD-dependent dihydropyrimidine dehydrogenase PreA subunit
MTALGFSFCALSALLVAAHALRNGEIGLMSAALGAIGLLFSRRAWALPVVRALLVCASLFWVRVGGDLVAARMALGAPWHRLSMILCAVAVVPLLAAWLLGPERTARRFSGHAESARASAAAFLITAGLLAIVQLKVARPMLLAERFLAGGGWLEILALAAYAAWLSGAMLDTRRQPLLRRRAWLAFTVVFFGQLALGLAGFERFLMSGTLHLPVPAVILAGPLYRGEGLFMPILFGAALLAVGPAWCSHLCYFGALDALASSRRRRPAPLPRWVRSARFATVAAVALGALGLRLAGAPTALAAWAGLGFGAVGLGAMALWSRRAGFMAHCTWLCPMGALATTLGKLSPFRVRLAESCDGCGACALACRYGALEAGDIARRSPGATCALCGDCVGRCKSRSAEYRFGPWRGDRVRAAFIAVVVALHAAFLGVARV